MKFKRGDRTKFFSVYDNAKDLAKFLRDPNTRKELLSMGYDPSVNASKRVRDNKTGKIVREYDNGNAEKKFNNDKILLNYLYNNGSVKDKDVEYFDNNYRNINSGNKHLVMYPSNRYNSGPTKDGRFDDGSFNYHGYKVDTYTPNSKYIDINGTKYEVALTSPSERRDIGSSHSVDFGQWSKGDESGYNSNIVNKPENIKPLFNAIYDTVSDYSPNKISYSAAVGGGKDERELKQHQNDIFTHKITPTKEEYDFIKSNLDANGRLHLTESDYSKLAKQGKLPSNWQAIYNNGLKKQRQRLLLYGRKMNNILPDAKVISEPIDQSGRYEWNLSNANWNQGRKNLGY